MKGIHVVVAAVLVAVLCPIASVYAQSDKVLTELQNCKSIESDIDRAFCETNVVFSFREALPKESITGEPIRYDIPNVDFWADIPEPAIGTIEIMIDGTKGNGSTIGWTGSINDGDTYDGRGKSVFHVKCIEGQNYNLNFHKAEEDGVLEITVYRFDEESDGVILRDEGSTEAAFGGVLLSGTCHY